MESQFREIKPFQDCKCLWLGLLLLPPFLFASLPILIVSQAQPLYPPILNQSCIRQFPPARFILLFLLPSVLPFHPSQVQTIMNKRINITKLIPTLELKQEQAVARIHSLLFREIISPIILFSLLRRWFTNSPCHFSNIHSHRIFNCFPI